MNNYMKETGMNALDLNETEGICGGSRQWDDIWQKVEKTAGDIAANWKDYIPDQGTIDYWKKIYTDDPGFWKKYVPDADWGKFIPMRIR